MADGVTVPVADRGPQPKKDRGRKPDGVTEAVAQSDPQPAKGKSRKWLIIGVSVLLAAVVGAGVYYFVARNPAADGAKATGKVAQAAAEKVSHKPMLYLPMETFTVNLRTADQERYLQVTMNLEVGDTDTLDALKQQMPSVRNRVLLMLSSKDAADLMTREGKEKLAAEISGELRKSLDGAGPNKGLEQVLFSHFVIQ